YARDYTLTVRVGDEAVLTAVLCAQRASSNRIGRECRRIEAGGLEDWDPSGVLTIRDQTCEMHDDMRSLVDALSLCSPFAVGPLSPGHLMAIRRDDRSQGIC